MRPGHHGLVAVSGTYRDHYRHAVGFPAASTSFSERLERRHG